MTLSLSKSIVQSINTEIQNVRQSRSTLDVYQVAEAIRRENAAENVALEDIIASLVLAAGANVPVEFRREWASGQTSTKGSGAKIEVMLPSEDVVLQ